MAGFYKGWECPGCGVLIKRLKVQFPTGRQEFIKYCPYCGWQLVIEKNTDRDTPGAHRIAGARWRDTAEEYYAEEREKQQASSIYGQTPEYPFAFLLNR